MTSNVNSKEIVVSVDAKVVALVLILAGSLVSGIVLYQWMARSADRTAQDEALGLSNQHFWDTGPEAEAAIVVVNAAGPDAALKKLVVGGIVCNWNNVYYWKTENGPVSSELEPTSTELYGSSFNIVIDGIVRNFAQGDSALELESHWTVVLYMRNAGNVSSTSVPNKIVLSVFTESKLYYAEAYVEPQFTFMATEQIQITNIQFGGTSTKWIALTVNNTGTSAVTINEAWVLTTKMTNTNLDPDLPKSIEANKGMLLNITYTWSSGFNYLYKLLSSKGNQFYYSAYAPT